MRGAICILLSFMLLFTLSASDVPERTRLSAWWGLLFPQMFSVPDGSERVVFEWPLVMRVFRLFG